jgi:hypothetical protein
MQRDVSRLCPTPDALRRARRLRTDEHCSSPSYLTARPEIPEEPAQLAALTEANALVAVGLESRAVRARSVLLRRRDDRLTDSETVVAIRCLPAADARCSQITSRRDGGERIARRRDAPAR